MARSGDGGRLDRLVLIALIAAQHGIDDRNIPVSEMPNVLMGKVDDLAKLLMIADRPVAVLDHVRLDGGDPGVVAREEVSEILLGLVRAYQQEATRQKLLIKKAGLTQSRLVFVREAFRRDAVQRPNAPFTAGRPGCPSSVVTPSSHPSSRSGIAVIMALAASAGCSPSFVMRRIPWFS